MNLGRKVPRTEEKRWGKTITVQCFPLQSVLVALGNPIVDYFSLDVEGSEFPILKSLDWENVNISGAILILRKSKRVQGTIERYYSAPNNQLSLISVQQSKNKETYHTACIGF